MPVYYLAYGSNLHPFRLTQRIASAELLGVAALPGKRLSFDKQSRDGSAKCMFVETGAPDHNLHGAVYSIDPREKATLDAIEGVGLGYDVQIVEARIDGVVYEAFTYAAATTHVRPGLLPYHWYRELVLLGAQYHGLPDDYVATIAAVTSVDDPDVDRARDKAMLLRAMRALNPVK